VAEFATGIAAPIDLHVTSDGSLYYLARDAGEVIRVSFPPQSFPWHNPRNADDVNADGFVAPNDALAVINFLNAHPPGSGEATSAIAQHTIGDDNIEAIFDLIAADMVSQARRRSAS